MSRDPSPITPGPDGSNPLSYPILVQPVLDKACVSCHNHEKAEGKVNLTSEPQGHYTASYNALVSRVHFSAWGLPDNGEPATVPGRFGAINSPLMKLLRDGHAGVTLGRRRPRSARHLDRCQRPLLRHVQPRRPGPPAPRRAHRRPRYPVEHTTMLPQAPTFAPPFNRFAHLHRVCSFAVSFRRLLPAILLFCGAAPACADYSTKPQDVAFTARCDGSTQHYVLLLPEPFDAEQPHDLLIALHGHGSDRWQFAKDPRDECRSVRDVGRPAQNDLRVARLSCQDVLDGPQGRSRPRADHRRPQTPLPASAGSSFAAVPWAEAPA